MEASISARFERSVVTVRISVISPNLGTRRHFFLWRLHRNTASKARLATIIDARGIRPLRTIGKGHEEIGQLYVAALLAAWRRIGFCLLTSKRYRPWKIDDLTQFC
jgi:hypothetical protein